MQYVPQTTTDWRAWIAWGALTVIALFVMGSIFVAPIAVTHSDTFLALSIYQGFSHLCHQIPERSFFISGHPLAVCARCTGLYAGFAGAALFYPLIKSVKRRDTPPRKWLIVAALPLAIDFGLGFFNVWSNTHWSRFSTGALLGAVSVFFVVPGLVELSHVGLNRKSKPQQPLRPQTANAPSDYSAPHRRI